MIRKILQSALCICLAPLLVAQQMGQTPVNPVKATPSHGPSTTPSPTTVTIPRDTKIELVSLDNVSSEFAVAGSPVRFAVAQDVVVDGVTVISAGTPLTGFVTKAKRGVARHRWAGLTIRVREIQAGPGLKLRLGASNPEQRARPGDYFDYLGTCVVLLPFCVALVILAKEGCGEDSCPHGKDSDGQQALLPQCVSEEFWVRSAVTVSSDQLAEERIAASTYPAIPCVRIIDRSKIFGQPGISFVEFQ
jgi:hypothetical protein